MDQDRRAILQMLAEGKITADEAERLISATERRTEEPPILGAAAAAPRRPARYLRVVVDANEPGEDGPTKVNIKVPMQLLRAGVRLSSVIPAEAREKVNAAMAERGVPFDLSQLKPENLEALIEQLGELSVDVDQERTKVRIFCE
jgi:hypothetical protein